MNDDYVFQKIQNVLATPPLILIGSGASVPYKYPTMGALGEALINEIRPSEPCEPWIEFRNRMKAGKDLESALTALQLPEELLNQIRFVTWRMIAHADIELFKDLVFNRKHLSLEKLLYFFARTEPGAVDVVTTNYDRVIEFACDNMSLPVFTGFVGCVKQEFRHCWGEKYCVNLFKVHGSVDCFEKDEHHISLKLPIAENVTYSSLKVDLITPGVSKCEAILHGTRRDILAAADRRIQKATAFLCIGYGFNDTQIQETVIRSISSRTPIVVLTKCLTEKARRLITENAREYILILEGEAPGTTYVNVSGAETVLKDGKYPYWSIDGLNSILMGE